MNIPTVSDEDLHQQEILLMSTRICGIPRELWYELSQEQQHVAISAWSSLANVMAENENLRQRVMELQTANDFLRKRIAELENESQLEELNKGVVSLPMKHKKLW